MEEYWTMTPGGMYGSCFKADSFEAAAVKAERAGYNVVDFAELGERHILVVPE